MTICEDFTRRWRVRGAASGGSVGGGGSRLRHGRRGTLFAGDDDFDRVALVIVDQRNPGVACLEPSSVTVSAKDGSARRMEF